MTAQRRLGKPHGSARTAGVSGEVWGATQNQGGHARTGKPRIYPTYVSWAQPEISRGRRSDLPKWDRDARA